MTIADDLAPVLAILQGARDILDARVTERAIPAWCEGRGWTEVLRALDDETLARCEEHGLASEAGSLRDAPLDLVALAGAVRAATDIAPIATGREAPRAESLRAVGARKREQLALLLGAVAPMAARASRIVDVGAGSGHFTRLAADLFDREALGIERVAARVVAARERASQESIAARYVAVDVGREPLALEATDLAVGLHACGAVGDRLVEAALAAGAGVALVSCCLQKIDGARREPLSRAAAGLVLDRDVLGLTNLTAHRDGVEVSLDATLEARRVRFALRELLRERGVVVSPGGEMHGINRRRPRRGLRAAAEQALAHRGLAPPSDAELRRHDAGSRDAHALIRRLSLPRNMLARVVEIAIVLDRAAALEEKGYRVRAGVLFDASVTPRNLAVLGER